MNFATLFVFFISFATAFAKTYPIKLYVDSNNHSIDNYGLQLYHEVGNTYWFFLNINRASTLLYDDTTRYIYYNVNQQTRIFFKLQQDTLLMSPAGSPDRVYIDYKTYRLSFENSGRLYAVKNVDDPKNISRNYYAIKHYQNPNNVPRGAFRINYLYARFI